MSGDIELGYETNPGAIGANLAVIYFNLSGQLCYVGNDGVEHPLPALTGNDATITGNLTVTGNVTCNSSETVTGNLSTTGTLTATGIVKPASNGAPSLGQGGLGFKELFLDYTNTATVGAVTINKASGRVNIAANATSLVVTNNIVTANSKVMAVASANDATGRVTAVVPNAGNFTIYCVAPTANMAVDFVVFGAD